MDRVTYPCSGGCGLALDKPDAWCLLCWPKKIASGSDPNRPEPVKDLNQIRADIHHHAHLLRFGRKDQQIAALEQIAHLVFVLQHAETHNKQT